MIPSVAGLYSFPEAFRVSFTSENFIQGNFISQVSGVDLFPLSDRLHKD